MKRNTHTTRTDRPRKRARAVVVVRNRGGDELADRAGAPTADALPATWQFLARLTVLRPT